MELSLDWIRDHFDQQHPAVSQHRVKTYRTLRQECPVTRSDAHGGYWVVSRHADLVAAARDHKQIISGNGYTIPDLGNPMTAIPNELDEPVHTVFRKALWSFLTPTAIRKYESRIREAVDALIDEFIEKGEADIVPALADPVPIVVTGIMFGLDNDGTSQFRGWFKTLIEAVDAKDEQAKAEVGMKFLGFLWEVLQRATDDPDREGLVAAAFEGRHLDGSPFTDEEKLGLLWNSAAAATETTASAISHALYHIAIEPGVRERLIDDPSLIPQAIEETLRLESPSAGIGRSARCPVTIGGQQIPEGDKIFLLWPSGNLDETVYPNPERFDLDRSTKSHLAFGHGIHMCVGQHIARLEMRVVIEQILKRIPDYEIAEDAPPPRVLAGIFWGRAALPIRFTPVALRAGSPA
jgi:cytochrome P450